MPSTFGCVGFFYAFTLASAISKERICYTPCWSVMDRRSLETGTLQRVRVANPLFYFFMPKCYYRAKHLQSVMKVSNNCPTKASGSPAKAALTQIPPNAEQILKSWFADPLRVRLVRTHLRGWFLERVLHGPGDFGEDLEVQILHYEILDELLCELLR